MPSMTVIVYAPTHRCLLIVRVPSGASTIHVGIKVTASPLGECYSLHMTLSALYASSSLGKPGYLERNGTLSQGRLLRQFE